MASLFLLPACGGQKSGETMVEAESLTEMEMDASPVNSGLPYSVEMKTEEETYHSVIDGRLLVRGIYSYPVVQSEAMPANYSEKTDTLSPTEQAATRVNAYFEQWIKDQKVNFDEIATMAEGNYSAALNGGENVWKDADYHYFDEVNVSSWNNRHLVCISFLHNSFTGGPHGISNRQAVTFDAYTGREVTINDMTDDYTGLCRAVETEILRQIQEQIEQSGKSSFFKDYEEVIPQWMNRSVFFEDDGLQVVFSVYDIAPYAAGEQAFKIPYQLIDTYLNSYGLKMLELS